MFSRLPQLEGRDQFLLPGFEHNIELGWENFREQNFSFKKDALYITNIEILCLQEKLLYF